MKYFAKLGLNSKVVTVLNVHDNDAPNEKTGIEFLNNLYNYPFWKQSFKDGSIRKNGAGIGYTYDEDRDAFIPKKPYTSWVLNESTCQWEAPIALPDSESFKKYNWNESTKSWDEID
tara:strand:+ start:1281 stop:1631 length:351 start_codon:yes stop_codon:yes gene_type:complete